MSSLDRLKQYEKPLRAGNWQGSSRDESNISRWSNRATAESKIAPRARGGEMKLPSTGKQTELRDTSMSPRAARNADARMVAKDDKNFVGDSSYMAGVRRQT
jgi:hypothetical protein